MGLDKLFTTAFIYSIYKYLQLVRTYKNRLIEAVKSFKKL